MKLFDIIVNISLLKIVFLVVVGTAKEIINEIYSKEKNFTLVAKKCELLLGKCEQPPFKFVTFDLDLIRYS